MSSKTKQCSRCEKHKPLDEFRSCALAKDGRVGHCKACTAPRKKRASAADPDLAIKEGDGPMISCEPSIGFSAQRQGADIIIEQVSADGVATVWLTVDEALRLRAWLATVAANPSDAAT